MEVSVKKSKISSPGLYGLSKIGAIKIPAISVKSFLTIYFNFIADVTEQQ
jgi:hypothetical protein